MFGLCEIAESLMERSLSGRDTALYVQMFARSRQQGPPSCIRWNQQKSSTNSPDDVIAP